MGRITQGYRWGVKRSWRRGWPASMGSRSWRFAAAGGCRSSAMPARPAAIWHGPPTGVHRCGGRPQTATGARRSERGGETETDRGAAQSTFALGTRTAELIGQMDNGPFPALWGSTSVAGMGLATNLRGQLQCRALRSSGAGSGVAPDVMSGSEIPSIKSLIRALLHAVFLERHVNWRSLMYLDIL